MRIYDFTTWLLQGCKSYFLNYQYETLNEVDSIIRDV